MNYKNPFNNRIQNNNKNIDNEYDFNLYDPYKNKKEKINSEYNQIHNNNLQNKEFAIIYENYLSKIKPLNSSSNYISCSSDIYPSNEDTSSKLGIPITLSLSPLAETEGQAKLPLVNYGSNDIPRCKNKNCDIFLNPFVKFIDNGERWICNFCGEKNDTEDYYFSDLDKNGERLDADTKPELCCGSYEFVANKSYYKKNKNPTRAFFMFLFDTSLNSINSGFLDACIEGVKDAINNNIFYNGNEVNISIITYDSEICYYSYGEKFTQPQMLIVTDEPTFLPTSKINLILNIDDDKDKILQIFDLIQSTYNINNINLNLKNHIKDSDKIFSALNSGYLLGKNLGGKILIFSASNNLAKLPKMVGGVDINSTKEQIAYSCNDNKQIEIMGINLTNDNISVDLFISAEKNINLITLNQLCDFTNGNLYFYRKFDINLHYKNIYNQIRRVLSRPIIWEGLNKIKFSNGCGITNFISPLLILKNELFVFPTVDSDQNYIFNIGYGKPNENENNSKNKNDLTNNNFNSIKEKSNFIYIQNSLLYSYGNGKRRIRIHNLCLPLCSDPKIILESMNSEIIANYYIKLTIDKLYKSKSLSNSLIYTEAQFRSFIDKVFVILNKLPDNLSYLPYYILGLFKSKFFCQNEINNNFDIDSSNYFRTKLLKMHTKEVLSYIIPTIYYLNDIEKDDTIGQYNEESGEFNLPQSINCTKNEIKEDGLYLIDIGHLLILFICKKINKKILQTLFGLNEFYFNIKLNEDIFFEEKNNFKEKIINIVNYLREGKSNFQNLIIVWEGTEGEKLVHECFIEDNNCKWFYMNYEKFYKKYIEDSYNVSSYIY